MCKHTNRFALRRRFTLILLILLIISLLIFILLVEQKSSFSPAIADRIILFIRTSHHCQSRLNYLLQSWIPSDPTTQSNIYLLTDKISKYSSRSKIEQFANVIETNCSQTHSRFDLCCKTAHEFQLFYKLSQVHPNRDWLCRFDDDQYVNRRNLYRFLLQFNPLRPYYIGRKSITNRLKLPEYNGTLTFATYGAGVCFSRAFLDRLRPYVNITVFPHGCMKYRLADDVYIGYITKFFLNISLLSFEELFHSHLERLHLSFRRFDIKQLQRAITFGFAWDRYPLAWLPTIYQLVQLIDKGEETAADHLWRFFQNYEKQHPENAKDKYDQSCTSYQRKDNLTRSV